MRGSASYDNHLSKLHSCAKLFPNSDLISLYWKKRRIMHILNLPNELLLCIAKILLLPKDLRSLILANRRLHHLLTPLLHGFACKAEYTPTALFWAAAYGDKQFVRFLLEEGGKKSTWGGPEICVICPTALFWATVRGDEPIVRFLLEREVGDASRGTICPAIIHRVSEKASDEVTAYVLRQGVNLVLRYYLNDYTPLQWAMKIGHLRLVKLLLERGASLVAGYKYNYQYCVGTESEIHLAIKHEDSEMFELLLEHGADVHSKSQLEDSTLHAAAEGWNGEILVTLLERGVYVNTRNKYGRTPLFNAVEHGKAENVRLLLEGGADVNAVDDDGRTAAQRATNLLMMDPGDPSMIGFRATHEEYYDTLKVLQEYLREHVKD